MTDKGWKNLIVDAVKKHENGDSASLDLLVRLVQESEESKQLLRSAGYGCSGMSLKKTVQEVLDSVLARMD